MPHGIPGIYNSGGKEESITCSSKSVSRVRIPLSPADRANDLGVALLAQPLFEVLFEIVEGRQIVRQRADFASRSHAGAPGNGNRAVRVLQLHCAAAALGPVNSGQRSLLAGLVNDAVTAGVHVGLETGEARRGAEAGAWRDGGGNVSAGCDRAAQDGQIRFRHGG